MAALLVGIAVLSVMLSVAMPVWRHEMQREREAELVFRGEQYVRAIGLFQRKYPGRLPPSLDILVTERFLRKKYKDPMTEDGEFRLIAAGAGQESQPGGPGQPGVPGQSGGQRGQTGGSGSRQPALTATVQPPMPSLNRPLGQAGSQPGSMQPAVSAGIIGVASKSKEKSILIYKGRRKYDEWQFIFANIGPRPGVPGPGQPGVPGQPGMGPGGFPRPGRPGPPGSPGPRRPGPGGERSIFDQRPVRPGVPR